MAPTQQWRTPRRLRMAGGGSFGWAESILIAWKLPPKIRFEMTLHLEPELQTELRRHAASAYPLEGCGLLLGTRIGDRANVVRVTLAENRSRVRERYEIDPLHLMRAESDARALGIEVLGVWHSHPDRPAVPSGLDRLGAWPGWSYAIVSVEDGRSASLCSWRLEGEAFEEEAVLSNGHRES